MTDNNCVCSPHQQPACAHWRMGNCPDKPPLTKEDVEAIRKKMREGSK